MVYTVVRLVSEDYSVPSGSLGLVDEQLKHIPSVYAIRWLPPNSGTSVPVHEEHLEKAGEFLLPIPDHLVEK
jgi:hypothetical protein